MQERAQLAAASAGAAANVFVGQPVPALYEASAAAAAAHVAAPAVVPEEHAATVALEERGREKVAAAATGNVVADELAAEGLPEAKVRRRALCV